MMNRMKTDKKTLEDLLERLEKLYAGYATTVRSATDQYRLQELTKLVPDYTYNPADTIIRENLIEHVGSLPMVATELYPYINNPEVDLGKALIMLAIHDIGELTVGDTNTFVKGNSNNEKQAERDAAHELLHPSYLPLYSEVEERSSVTGEFAKSIDKIAPDILDYMVPVEITVERFKHFVNIEPEEMVDLIIKHKRPYMLWNPFLTDFHIMLVDKFKEKLEAYLKETHAK
jgi:5'-deoxynucleotidase YfbR-like HD superfamily hydrolase